MTLTGRRRQSLVAATTRGRDRHTSRTAGLSGAAALCLAPAVAFLGTCLIAPLLYFFALSFAGDGGWSAAFETLLSSAAYRRIFAETIEISLIVTLICIVLATPVAYSLARVKGAWFYLLLYVVLFPFWISLLVRTFAWMLLLERDGVINRALVASGLINEPIPLLYNQTGVVIGMVHVLLPYAILPIFARMRAIDSRLLMASDGLGASAFDTLRLVYLPLVAPGLAAGAAVVFLLALGFFVTPALLGGASSMTVATMVSGFISERLAWALAAAASIILVVIVGLTMAVAHRVAPFGEPARAR